MGAQIGTTAPGIAEVTELPGYGKVAERQLAGYLPVGRPGCEAYLYFWLVESRNDPATDPVVLWLNGGPGSSSFLGMFWENGPYKIGDDLSLRDNPFSWNTNATYLMIDQPAGTGLSLVSSEECSVHDEQEATAQLYRGLQYLFDHCPEYRERRFYAFGESFAGVYVPMLASAILDGNAAGEPRIDLAGIGVGDGWVDPLVQQATYGDYAYAHGLVGPEEKRRVDLLYADCARAIEESQPVTSRRVDEICNKIEQYITEASGGANVYDVRVTGDYDFGLIGRYLDQPSVRSALRVAPDVGPWSDTSKSIAYLLERGEQNSAAHLYPSLFEQIPVLVYNGVYDMDCNFMGTDAWIGSLDWPDRDRYLAAPRRPWIVAGAVAGHIRHAGNLTQVLVDGAGHLVPLDQPRTALALLDGFVGGSLGGGAGT